MRFFRGYSGKDLLMVKCQFLLTDVFIFAPVLDVYFQQVKNSRLAVIFLSELERYCSTLIWLGFSWFHNHEL